MKFYLAMLQQEEADRLACLLRHGFPDAKARRLIANAQIHNSAVVAPIDRTRALVIAPHPETGRLCSWRAITEFLEKAEAEEVLGGLKQHHPEQSWALFAFSEAEGMNRSRPN